MINEKMRNMNWDKFNEQLSKWLDDAYGLQIIKITPAKLEEAYVRLICMYPQYIDQLLQIWDRLVSGEDYMIIKSWARDNVIEDQEFIGSISYYGKKTSRTPGKYKNSIQIKNLVIEKRKTIGSSANSAHLNSKLFGHGGSREKWS